MRGTSVMSIPVPTMAMRLEDKTNTELKNGVAQSLAPAHLKLAQGLSSLGPLWFRVAQAFRPALRTPFKIGFSR